MVRRVRPPRRGAPAKAGGTRRRRLGGAEDGVEGRLGLAVLVEDERVVGPAGHRGTVLLRHAVVDAPEHDPVDHVALAVEQVEELGVAVRQRAPDVGGEPVYGAR